MAKKREKPDLSWLDKVNEDLDAMPLLEQAGIMESVVENLKHYYFVAISLGTRLGVALAEGVLNREEKRRFYKAHDGLMTVAKLLQEQFLSRKAKKPKKPRKKRRR